MTLASGVFDKVDMPRLQGNLFSSCNFNLSPAAECDHVLATRRSVPIGKTARRTAAKLGPGDLRHLEGIVRLPRRKLQLYLFGVSLIVRPRVEPRHEDGFVGLSSHYAMLCGLRAD